MLARRLLHHTTSYGRKYAAMASFEPSPERVQDLYENVTSIRSEMNEASASRSAEFASRQPRLVLVSKLKPPSDIMAAYQTLKEDERHFGENYVQEVRFSKFTAVHSRC